MKQVQERQNVFFLALPKSHHPNSSKSVLFFGVQSLDVKNTFLSMLDKPNTNDKSYNYYDDDDDNGNS